ncbi:hypothetical protein BDV10DRAFT_117333 [Aspergillus recurvatus]
MWPFTWLSEKGHYQFCCALIAHHCILAVRGIILDQSRPLPYSMSPEYREESHRAHASLHLNTSVIASGYWRPGHLGPSGIQSRPYDNHCPCSSKRLRRRKGEANLGLSSRVHRELGWLARDYINP